MEILNAHAGKCFECKQAIQRDKGWDIDHVIPLRIGGADAITNLVPLCRACHRIKTKADHKDIGKNRRTEQKSWGVKTQKGPKLQGRGFPKTDPQSKGVARHEEKMGHGLEAAKARGKGSLGPPRPLYERMP